MARPAAEVLRIGALELRVLVDRVRGSGRVVMFEMTVPAKARVPAPHYHREGDEVVYGLDGTLTMLLDGVTHELGCGDTLFVPCGSVHGFENLAGCPNALTP